LYRSGSSQGEPHGDEDLLDVPPVERADEDDLDDEADERAHDDRGDDADQKS
jgi:hypothetical protein